MRISSLLAGSIVPLGAVLFLIFADAIENPPQRQLQVIEPVFAQELSALQGPELLERTVLQLQDDVPLLAYLAMERNECSLMFAEGLQHARFDIDIAALDETLHEEECLDRYSHVYVTPSAEATVAAQAEMPPALEISIVDSTTLYLRVAHFMFQRGVIAEGFLALGLTHLRDVERVVLDLRGNRGGVVDAGADLLGFFPPSQTPLMTEDRDGMTPFPILYHPTMFASTIELVILVDRMSASMAEVVAGVLLDIYPSAQVVGETTYGKGLMQTILDIDLDADPFTRDRAPLTMVLTTGEFILPSGERVQGQGIAPTIYDQAILACEDPLCVLNRAEELVPPLGATALALP